MFRAAKNLGSPVIELYFSKWHLKGILLRFLYQNFLNTNHLEAALSIYTSGCIEAQPTCYC